MPRRYFNWKLAIVLVIGLSVLAVTAYGLRRWQRSSRAENALEIGNKAYEEQRWEEAATNLGRYIAVESDDVSALLKYADAQLNIRPLGHGNIQQAVSAYRIVLRVEKGNIDAAIRLTEVYLGMGMPGEAELIARRVLEINQAPELRKLLALSLAEQRKFDEAAAELEAIIESYPDQILAYEALWQLLRQRPEVSSELPESWLDRAVENNPSSAMAYIIRANFHFSNRDNASALADLEQAEKQDLSDIVVRLRLARGFIEASIFDKAEEHLSVVQTLEPTNFILWQTWAQLALKSESKEKMLKVAEAGLEELSSQPWDFMPIAAELFIRCDELGRATDCISELSQKDIAPATVAFLEGLVANSKGQNNGYEAVKCWRRAMELGDKTPRIRLAMASVLSRLGDTQLAMRELSTLVSERPDFLEGHLALARLLAQTGDWVQTADIAYRAMQLSPENPEAALLHLQARIQLLAARTTDKNAESWQDIEKQLSVLEKGTNGSLGVKLLQFQVAMEQRKFADAGVLIAQLKKTHPSQVRIAMAEVELLTSQNKTDEAVLVLNNAIKENPEAVEPVRYLAILLAWQGDREKCETVIKEALARIDKPADERELGLLLVQFYAQWGQEESVYKLLGNLAKKLPNDIPVKRRLLACRDVLKSPEKTQQLINDIKSLEGEDGRQWRYEQTKIWFGSDDFKDHQSQIISLLEESLRANPDDQESRMLLAATYERIGNLQVALSTYSRALDRSPRDLRIIIPMVSALYRAKEYDKADEILSRAAADKLDHPQLQRLQLQSYLRHGQLDPASDVMDDLLSKDPNDRAVALSLAILKIQQNKFDEAGKLLGELKAHDPNALPVIVAQIQLSIRQGEPEEAVRLCNETVSNLNNASAYVLRARTYTTIGQTDRAKEDLEYAVTIEPENVEAWVAKSDFYRFTGQLDKASADIKQAISIAPDNLGIQKRAVLLFLASDNPDILEHGRAILDKALESNPDDIELQLYKARLLVVEGTAPATEKAAAILQKITDDQPENGEAWGLLGELALRDGQIAKAMDSVLRGLIHRPNDTALLLLKANIEAARSPALAIPTLKALWEKDPNNVEIAMNLAGTYVAAGEQEKAVKLLREQLSVCKDDPTRRRCNIALASALYKNGNKDEAEKLFGSLFESDPNDPRVLLAQCSLFNEDGRYADIMAKANDWFEQHPQHSQILISIAEELTKGGDSAVMKTAEDILRMVIAKMPEHPRAMFSLAILLQMTGRNAEAVELNQRIVALQPDNIIAINNLAWLMCEEQGKYQQAFDLAERGLQIAPQYADLIDTHGMACYRLGKFNEAIQDFTSCIELYPAQSPGRVSSYFHLARAFAGLGERDKAISYLNQTLDLESQVGGLSPADLNEAQNLLKALSKEN
ncbi:MAG: tetratricopeptide repeat protein [Phycisphaerae bacterium]|nr:tetratricopeptide repeat protein [Phycisphaerae bacterium]